MRRDGLPDAEEQLAADLGKLMAEPWGRRIAFFLTHVLADVEAPTFDPTVRDGVCAALHQSRLEGAREVGLSLSKRLRKVDSHGYITAIADGMRVRDMRTEQSKREKQR